MTPRRIVVVGAGVAGLAAARALSQAPQIEVLLLERAARPGGLIETERTPDGFVVEYGADTLVTTKPWGVETARAVGLGDAIVIGGGARRSFVAAGDRLQPVPQLFAGISAAAAWSLLRTPLLSVAAKARVALEPFVPRRRSDDDESVRAFVERRFGRELLEAVIQPVFGGIYGGDTSRLSADACVARMREFERDDGSVIVGMQRAIRAHRDRVRAGERALPPVVSFRDGMGSLTDAIATRLGDRIRYGCTVERIERGTATSFRIHATNGTIDCDGVVLAAPAWQVPQLIDQLAPDLAAALGALPHKALDCVSLAFPRRDVGHPLDGTGWVRASGDPRPTLACTWASQKWPGRAPDGVVLLRSVLSMPAATDDELVEQAQRDLRDLLGVKGVPTLVRVRRIPRATPIYAVGHLVAAARMADQARALGAVALAGNAHAGVGVPDCGASGEHAARSVLAALDG